MSNITITTYNEDGTVANVESVAVHMVNTPEELEALFAAVANA